MFCGVVLGLLVVASTVSGEFVCSVVWFLVCLLLLPLCVGSLCVLWCGSWFACCCFHCVWGVCVFCGVVLGLLVVASTVCGEFVCSVVWFLVSYLV